MKKTKVKEIIIDWNRGLIYEGKKSRGLTPKESIEYQLLMKNIDATYLGSKNDYE